MRASAAWQWRRLSYYMKPTICMVNGWCFGGAFNHLIACDLAIADEEAQLGLSEINWGIIPAGNVLKSVASVMNQRDALYYTMTGEPFSGRKAAEMGLVNEAVPKAKLRPRVRELAKNLLGKNPTVLRTAKHACRRVRSMDWDEVGGLPVREIRPVALPRSREGAREGHEPVPRRQDLPPRARPLSPRKLSGTRHGFRLHRGAAPAARQRPQADGQARDAATTCAGSTASRPIRTSSTTPGSRPGCCAAVPRGIRRARRQRHRHGDHRRGDVAHQRRFLHVLRRQRVLRPQPACARRSEEQKRHWLPKLVSGRDQDVDLDVGAGRRLRRRRDAHHRGARRQPLGDQRPEAVGDRRRRQEQRHQRLREDRPQGALPPGHVAVPGRQRHARRRAAQARHARPPLHRHLRDLLQRRARDARPAGRRREQGLGLPALRPAGRARHLGGEQLRRRARRWSTWRCELRQGAQAVRPPDRHQPGDRPHARRHGRPRSRPRAR